MKERVNDALWIMWILGSLTGGCAVASAAAAAEHSWGQSGVMFFFFALGFATSVAVAKDTIRGLEKRETP